MRMKASAWIAISIHHPKQSLGSDLLGRMKNEGMAEVRGSIPSFQKTNLMRRDFKSMAQQSSDQLCRSADATGGKRRVAFLNTHPIQYFAPMYRKLNTSGDLSV